MVLNAGGLVYGTILVAALLSAETAVRETYLDTILAVVAAVLAYWLTITYAALAGERLEHSEPITVRFVARVALEETPLLVGAAVQLVILLVFWAAGASLDTAVAADVWCAVGLIILAEVVIGVRSGLEGRELAGQIGLGAVLGLLVITIRLLLH